MCGRYTLTQVGPRLVGERFELGQAEIEPATLGRFNVCPTEDILVVDAQGAAGGPVGARAVVLEGAQQRAADDQRAGRERREQEGRSRGCWSGRERRCLVIADGWYEWLKSEKKGEPRVPFRYTIDGGELFAFAGLCDVAKIDDEWVPSATILTTTANAISAPVHDRMPVVLAGPDEEAAWMAGRRSRAARPDRERADVGRARQPRGQQGGRRGT